MGSPVTSSRLFQGDNLAVMDRLIAKGVAVDLIVTDPPFFTGKEQRREDVAYSDAWETLDDYLAWLRATIERCHTLLAPTGSLFLHLDWHASHHARVILDEVFGAARFRNEIIWCYTGPGSPAMGQFNRKHDTILWYSRGSEWTFHRDAVRVPHSAKTQANFRGDLEGSGFANGGYELDGDGKVPEDWWTFAIAARFPVDGQTRVGYPTEKPVALVERIVLAASSEGDLVADLLCGGGTVPFVAAKHGRRWIAGDLSPDAVEMTRRRMESAGEGVELVAVD
jgi:DNA modification methylase